MWRNTACLHGRRQVALSVALRPGFTWTDAVACRAADQGDPGTVWKWTGRMEACSWSFECPSSFVRPRSPLLVTRSNPRNQSLTGQSFISSDRETTPLLPSPYVFPSPTLEPDVGGEQACKLVFTLGRIQFLFIFSKAVRPGVPSPLCFPFV